VITETYVKTDHDLDGPRQGASETLLAQGVSPVELCDRLDRGGIEPPRDARYSCVQREAEHVITAVAGVVEHDSARAVLPRQIDSL
jgi:hypothetical protein